MPLHNGWSFVQLSYTCTAAIAPPTTHSHIGFSVEAYGKQILISALAVVIIILMAELRSSVFFEIIYYSYLSGQASQKTS